jgi:hypothetical protein
MRTRGALLAADVEGADGQRRRSAAVVGQAARDGGAADQDGSGRGAGQDHPQPPRAMTPGPVMDHGLIGGRGGQDALPELRSRPAGRLSFGLAFRQRRGHPGVVADRALAPAARAAWRRCSADSRRTVSTALWWVRLSSQLRTVPPHQPGPGEGRVTNLGG